MNHQPLTQAQTEERLEHCAASGASPDDFLVASACLWLTADPDDDAPTRAHWGEICNLFTRYYSRFCPGGTVLGPSPLAESPAKLEGFRASLHGPIQLWIAARSAVFRDKPDNGPAPATTTGQKGVDRQPLGAPPTPHREITVRPAKPAAKGARLTADGGPRARWTPDELKAAIHAADEIAHLVNGNAPIPGSLDGNARDALLASWAGGMTRSEFAAALLVGRERELRVIQDGINRIQIGGSCIHFITGLNGVGKSFLLEAVVALAIEQGLAVAQVEFTAQDRLCDNDGATRRLLTRLISELRFGGDSTASGLVPLLDQLCIVALNNTQPSPKEVRKLIETHCLSLILQPGGEDVVKVLLHYAQHTGDLGRQVKVLKWLRAEYDSVSNARKDLGVSSVIGDGDFLKHLTTIATLCRLAGKQGLLVVCDELTVFVRSLHKSVRQANFDTILNAYNSSANGRSQGLGFVFAGTADCLDPRQGGLFSHAALASRLQGASTPKGIFSSGPILQLKPLLPVELFVALQKARELALGPDGASRLPDLALEHLIDTCLRPLGAQEFLAPRTVLQCFASVVQQLVANPSLTWQAAVGITEAGATATAGGNSPKIHAAFQNFKL